MANPEQPTPTPDLRTGQKVRLLVRPGDNEAVANLMNAVGTLSNDGKSFSIVVTREGGGQEKPHDLS